MASTCWQDAEISYKQFYSPEQSLLGKLSENVLQLELQTQFQNSWDTV